MFKYLIVFCCLSVAIAGVERGFSIHGESYIINRVVKLVGPAGSCSGEQVVASSGDNYILTAAHCKAIGMTDGSIVVELENKTRILRRVIAEDKNADLLLLEGVPNLDGLKIGQNNERFQIVRTFTHGRGFETYKTEGRILQFSKIAVAIGFVTVEAPCTDAKYKQVDETIYDILTTKVCVLYTDAAVTTAMIVPGSSGGAVVDEDGQLVGVVSAGDGTFGYLVPLKDIKAFLTGY